MEKVLAIFCMNSKTFRIKCSAFLKPELSLGAYSKFDVFTKNRFWVNFKQNGKVGIQKKACQAFTLKSGGVRPKKQFFNSILTQSGRIQSPKFINNSNLNISLWKFIFNSIIPLKKLEKKKVLIFRLESPTLKKNLNLNETFSYIHDV